MTIEEKRNALDAMCDAISCDECALNHHADLICDFSDEECNSNEMIEKLYAEAFTVNHPGHYNRDGATECIDEMVLIFGVEAVKGFCLCNAWKYRYRAADKNGAEDLKKSDWYLAKYRELMGGDA